MDVSGRKALGLVSHILKGQCTVDGSRMEIKCPCLQIQALFQFRAVDFVQTEKCGGNEGITALSETQDASAVLDQYQAEAGAGAEFWRKGLIRGVLLHVAGR